MCASPPHVAHPVQVAPAGTTGAADGVCNEQVPNNSVYARFLWVVRFLTHNNFYVVIDNHLSNDNTALANPAQWAALWAQVPAPLSSSACRWHPRPGHPCKCQIATQVCMIPLRKGHCCALSKLTTGEASTSNSEHVLVQLLTDIIADAPSRNRVMIDILNEPDARGIK